MRFRYEIYNIIYVVFFKQCLNKLLAADITLDKVIMGIALRIFMIFKVAGISKLIQANDYDVRMLLKHIMNEI
jgi:hypothetical protein